MNVILNLQRPQIFMRKIINVNIETDKNVKVKI